MANTGSEHSAKVRSAKATERREAIRQYIGKRLGLSASHVRRHLAENGCQASLRTVSRDLTAVRATITPMAPDELEALFGKVLMAQKAQLAVFAPLAERRHET